MIVSRTVLFLLDSPAVEVNVFQESQNINLGSNKVNGPGCGWENDPILFVLFFASAKLNTRPNP